MAEANGNKYKPTPCEEKLILALANPENIGLSITDLCHVAGISRKTYYEAFKKPEFVQMCRETSFDLVKQAVMPVINTFVREAKKGSYNHGKVILEMAQVYTEKQQREITGQIAIRKLEDFF